MSKTLAELSSAASQGEWSPGHLGDETTKCNCRSVLTDRMLGCVFKALDPADVEERFRSEYPTDDESAANMRLVCELVNQFRSGRLVDRNAIIEECANALEDVDCNANDPCEVLRAIKSGILTPPKIMREDGK